MIQIFHNIHLERKKKKESIVSYKHDRAVPLEAFIGFPLGNSVKSNKHPIPKYISKGYRARTIERLMRLNLMITCYKYKFHTKRKKISYFQYFKHFDSFKLLKTVHKHLVGNCCDWYKTETLVSNDIEQWHENVVREIYTTGSMFRCFMFRCFISMNWFALKVKFRVFFSFTDLCCCLTWTYL